MNTSPNYRNKSVIISNSFTNSYIYLMSSFVSIINMNSMLSGIKELNSLPQ